MLYPMIGQQWGSYRLTRLLGGGTFADVYLGQHVRLGMQAAVKILRATLDDQVAESFQQEAHVVAALLHPHIVRLLDFDVQDDQPFLVLEYAPSGSLHQRHAHGEKLPLPLVVDYVNQVASALQYAHEQQLIHCDVKPANMLIGRQGEILLSDFGIAMIAHSTSSMPLQDLQGTPRYMAPEQIQGHPQVASDQYALGIAVYQWLTGSAPFQGSPNEVIDQHLATPPRPPHEFIPSISEEVEHVILTALAKEPGMRFGSVVAFAHALQQAMESVHPPTRSTLGHASHARLLASAMSPASGLAILESPLPPQPESPPAPQNQQPRKHPGEPEHSFLTPTFERWIQTMPTDVLLASPQAVNKRVTRPLTGVANPARHVNTRRGCLILSTVILVFLLIGGAILLENSASLYTSMIKNPGAGSGGLVPTASHPTQVVGANQDTPTATSPAGSNASPSSSSSTPGPQPTPAPGCLRASPASITTTQVLGANASLPGSALTLTNCSPASAHWTAAVQYNSGSGWTSCNPAGGTIPANSSQTIHLVAGSPTVLLGTYSARWIFSVGNANSTVKITLVVVAQVLKHA